MPQRKHSCLCTDRLANVAVVVSNNSYPSPIGMLLKNPDYTLCGQYSGIPPANSTQSFACAGSPIAARYVYVYLPTLLSTALALCEEEVFG